MNPEETLTATLAELLDDAEAELGRDLDDEEAESIIDEALAALDEDDDADEPSEE